MKNTVFENPRRQKMNECLTAILNEEGDVEKYELKIEFDTKNEDLIDFLIDYGLAGKIKPRLYKMFKDYTKGYMDFRREHSGGKWTPKCDEFRKEL